MRSSLLCITLLLGLSLPFVVAVDNIAAGEACGNADTCAAGSKCWDNVCREASADSPPNGLGNRCSADDCCPSGSGLICLEQELRCVPNNRFTPAVGCNDPNHQVGEFQPGTVWGPFQQTSTGVNIEGYGFYGNDGTFVAAENQNNPYGVQITSTGVYIAQGPDGQTYDIPFTSSGVNIPGIGNLNITGTGANGGDGNNGPDTGVVDASTGGIVIADGSNGAGAFATTSLFSLLALAASVALMVKGGQ